MENVTLTQKEQARLQVLNSLLAEHMALDQAATLMCVTHSPHQAYPGGLPGTGRRPPLLTVTGAAGQPTQRPMPWWPA